METLDLLFRKKKKDTFSIGGYPDFTFVLTSKGELYGYGKRCSGTPEGLDHLIPHKIFDQPVKQIACGGDHIAILTSSFLGTNVYTLGRGNEGQLGLENTKSRATPTQTSRLVKQVTCEDRRTIVLTKGGEVYVFGTRGPTGVKVEIDKPIKMISSDEYCTILLTYSGEVYIIGLRDDSPVKFVKLPPKEKVKQISSGRDFSVIITNKNKLYFQRYWHPFQRLFFETPPPY